MKGTRQATLERIVWLIGKAPVYLWVLIAARFLVEAKPVNHADQEGYAKSEAAW